MTRKIFSLLVLLAGPALADPTILPSGAYLTPLAAPGAQVSALNPHLPGFPTYTAGQAVNTALSPDGKTLLILTSGFNLTNSLRLNRAGTRLYVTCDNSGDVAIIDTRGNRVIAAITPPAPSTCSAPWKIFWAPAI